MLTVQKEVANDSFYTANQTTSIGLFRELDKQAAIFFTLDSAAQATIAFNDSLTDHFLITIALNDSILSDSIPESDSLNIFEENDIYKSLLYSVLNSSRQLMTALDTLHSFYSDSILSLNTAISVSNTIEANQKNINEIFYSTISRGILTFDSAQTATVYDIAIQCPESGGKAVPVAQSIYRLIVDTITFENDTNCGGSSPRMAKVENSKSKSSFVYPNPASNSATLKFSLPEKQFRWFIIYDVTSRELVRFPLYTESMEFEFNTDIMNTGIYYYKIISEGKIESNGKFTIVK